jgi:hypothetical protein
VGLQNLFTNFFIPHSPVFFEGQVFYVPHVGQWCILHSHQTGTYQFFVLQFFFFFFPVPVCAITASGVPGGTLVPMNRFSTLCG